MQVSKKVDSEEKKAVKKNAKKDLKKIVYITAVRNMKFKSATT